LAELIWIERGVNLGLSGKNPQQNGNTYLLACHMISTTTPLLKKAHNQGGYTKLGTEKVLYPDVAGPVDKVLLFLDDANAKVPCSNLLGAVQLIKFLLEVVSCTGYIHQAMRNECHPQFTTCTILDISGCSWALI
jgi:hypothetical protein